MNLYERLMWTAKENRYPMHMPGHKRAGLFTMANPYAFDVTEIDDTDNLHQPEGEILWEMEQMKQKYGTKDSYLLVNGSTCGILAAISACCHPGDTIVIARNCHRSVYHAVELLSLKPVYVYPEVDKETGICLGISSEEVKRVIADTKPACVVLTSPTYEGVVSNIRAIAEIVHEENSLLVVDEAHGAHFAWSDKFPETAMEQGADLVIESLHKTLPSFTQTALLHCNGTRIDPGRVARYLGVYETSSPSYLFMAGMDACIDLIREQGAELFAEYRRRLDAFYRDTADLAQLHVMRREDLCKEEAYDWDDSKLIIYAGAMGGEELHQELLGHYHLQMEMVSADYVLGMTSLMDTDEGMRRLVTALHEIDEKNRRMAEPHETAEENRKTELDGEVPEAGFTARMYRKNPRRMQIYQALDLPYREVPLDEAVGKMAADYVYLYPPGIPLIVPGEVITEEFIRHIRECRERKLNVEGQGNLAPGRIKIVYF